MSKFGIKTFAIVSALMALPANAQVGGPSNDTFTAEYLHTACNPPAGLSQADHGDFMLTCHLYFRGLTDGLFLMKFFTDKGNAGCLPKGSPISNAEAQGDFEHFLRDHPEAAQNSAAIVAVFGIMRAHPCSK